MNHIQLRDISKTYGSSGRSFTLNVESMDIKSGEFFGIVGESGSGKTTLLRSIAGLEHIDKGSIHIGGEDFTNIPPQRRGIGMVFQQPLLFPHMNIIKNVEFGLKMKKVSARDRRRISIGALEKVGLSGYESRYPSQLSGGQMQRVAIARALASNPKILLMDEPFSALDPNLRNDMREMTLKLQREYGITVLFVTHDRDEAFMLFDNMALVRSGKIVQTGTPRDMYERPGDEYVANFMGINNILRGTVEEGFIAFEDGKLPVPKGTVSNGAVSIRPESIRLIGGEDPPKEGFYFKGSVIDMKYRMGFLSIGIDSANGRIEAISTLDGQNDLNKGENVYITVKEGGIYYFKD
ncbi:putative spermidine/putrescine transport system ATP-binding protein [Peptoclostridium litorale DSM 5388]|uniref:ABC-type quaternary amine transporter n=1 Tax=Peptoclostridium litorale DSM 5388 TaxID=1121324 RepID=A0A069REA3_PEPLI|nr:ABC transporter ATP-binding protein [Peptoclostridium litorale]KDR93977.1 spermidine/putrescine import ATP-binding protein PotA [Peptoclostridium litorale DSM 5388]KDR95404.1 spermidine/putrescine import ATP-binding protein PotA [Peptoclostridium litorale DSM 5388]SIN89696.1 putative spermidine/putrescine transport system ATP-binding protein [Peptoclostridium litorale DSM 5388]